MQLCGLVLVAVVKGVISEVVVISVVAVVAGSVELLVTSSWSPVIIHAPVSLIIAPLLIFKQYGSPVTSS